MTGTGINQERTFHKPAIVIILTISALCLLSACSRQTETLYVYHEEPVYISVGESAALELDNMPEGKTAADFTWTITSDTAEISNGIVTGVQTYPSALSGKETASAELTVNGVRYHEVFHVVVEKDVASIELKYPSYTLITGDTLPVSYKTDPETLSNGQRVEWTFADEGIAELTEDNQLKALGAGKTVLTVRTGGAEDSCGVNVFDEPQTADEKLQYLCSWQDSYSRTGELNDTVSYQRSKSAGVEILFSELPVLTGAAGSGKYMVLWEVDYSTLPSSSYVLTNRNREENCSYTAALPAGVRPETWDEVEYIIRVRVGDYMQVGTYEAGIRAMACIVEITKETTDGEVLEVLSRIQGKIPDEIYVDQKMNPDPEAYYGSLPDIDKVKNALSAVIKALDE